MIDVDDLIAGVGVVDEVVVELVVNSVISNVCDMWCVKSDFAVAVVGCDGDSDADDVAGHPDDEAVVVGHVACADVVVCVGVGVCWMLCVDSDIHI